MEITNLIPKGRRNAIARRELRVLTNLNDRQTREEVRIAKCKGAPIINLQDGSGYFQATFDDKQWIEQQIRTNEKRAKAILYPNKFLKQMLKKIEARQVGD